MCMPDGMLGCSGRDVTRCEGGERVVIETCTLSQTCVVGGGCRMCQPGRTLCVGNEIHTCADDGNSTTLTRDCGATEACMSGACVDACAVARDARSNVGCDYFAVDLDNEYGEVLGMTLDARGEQFAVVLANPSDTPVEAQVFRSTGTVGVPVEELVTTATVPPNDLVRIDLPSREVDGSNGVGEGTATSLSSQAYRVRTNFPVVAYQFNPIVQSESNDASLLIPVPALDTKYRVIGWPTANPVEIPIGGMDIVGIPDHSFVTIVGTAFATNVTVTLGGPIVGAGTIPATPAGGTLNVALGPYDVLNLESEGAPGDLSGTVVESTLPVAVFSGGERGIAPIDRTAISAHPSGVPDDFCCTEHLEEQVFPTSSWGQKFVITRSAVRSAHPTWREPDIYRVMADQPGTTITTNLPAPNNSFTLGENEWREFNTDRSFTMEASAPISVMQILVSQGWVVDWKPGHGGDPSMLLYPPVEQYRDEYIFLVPDTFSANYVVASAPVGATIELDGAAITCPREPAGTINGVEHETITCPVDGGTHRIQGAETFGITVYGYHGVGSYAYAGGSNLERINLF